MSIAEEKKAEMQFHLDDLLALVDVLGLLLVLFVLVLLLGLALTIDHTQTQISPDHRPEPQLVSHLTADLNPNSELT
jgi:hypothetical protein